MSGADPRSHRSTRRAVELAIGRAERAEVAASRAAAAAERWEKLAALGGPDGEVYARLAMVHRENERCHRAAVSVQWEYARSLGSWMGWGERAGVRPVLMDAVAHRVGWRGAVLTLRTRAGVESLVAASDPSARRAHELEMALAEGPSWQAIRGSATAARGAELARLWPRYGPAAARLGVDAVAAVPFRPGSGQLRGSLTVTGRAPPGWAPDICALGDVADALARWVLGAPEGVDEQVLGLPGVVQLEKEDYQPALQQAAGSLSQRNGWSVEDAIALVRARAYVEERSVAEVATDVLLGKPVFTDAD